MYFVSILHSCTSRDPNVKVLLHHLSLMAAEHSFPFTASHELGRDNSIADDLSCFDFQHFHYLAPHSCATCIAGPASGGLKDKRQFYYQMVSGLPFLKCTTQRNAKFENFAVRILL